MPLHHRSPGAAPGHSLIEVLVVLAVLSLAGVTMLGNRRANAVRLLLDELEGALLDAQKYATSTGRDTALVPWGTPERTVPPGLARGDAALNSGAIKIAAEGLRSNPPVLPVSDLGKTVAHLFAPTADAQYRYATVVVNGSSAWTRAMTATASGAANENITRIVPFSTTDSSFQAAFAVGMNLFKGPTMATGEGDSHPVENQVFISGSIGRFTSSFHLRVVGTSNGLAQPGGAMLSGDRNNPLDTDYAEDKKPTQHRLTVVFDRQDHKVWDPTDGPATDANLLDAFPSTKSLTSESTVIQPVNDAYYLAPKDGNPKLGYYRNLPSAGSTGFVPKGITAPQVVAGSLYYSYFTQISVDPCSGGTGETRTSVICDALNPIVTDTSNTLA